MLKKLLIIGTSVLAFQAMPVFAQIANKTLPDYAVSQEQIDAAKKDAADTAGIAKSAYSKRVVEELQANGEVTRSVKQSENPLGDSLSSVKDTLGITGLTVNQNPTNGTGSAGLVTTTYQNSAKDFDCKKVNPGQTYTASPLSFKITSCNMAGSAVGSLSLSICEEGLYAGLCYEGVDGKENKNPYSHTLKLVANTGYVPYIAGAGTKFATPLNIGVGCNSTGVCRVTVTGEKSLGSASKDSMGTASVETRNSSTGVKALNDTFSSTAMANAQEKVSADLVYCNSRIQAAATKGDLAPCRKEGDADILPPSVKDNVSVAVGTSSPKSCSATGACKKYAEVAYKSFERTCRRTFPTTQQISSVTYKKTLSCEVSRDADTSSTLKSSCVDDKGNPTTAGMTKVGANCKSADCSTDQSWTEYWVISTPEISVTSASPARVKPGGVCSTDSYAPPNQCLRWFGRTLTDEACTASFSTGDTADAIAYLGANYTQKAGCGVCVDEVRTETCQAVEAPNDKEIANGALPVDSTDCEMPAENHCVFKSAVADSTSGTVVLSQLETYTCNPVRNKCVQWETADQGCNEASSGDIAVNTLGTGNLQASTGELSDSFTSALVDAATADGFAANSTSNNPSDPGAGGFTIFAGDLRTCRRPVGGLGSVFRQDCCRADLNRPEKDGVIQGGCNMSEVRLAAAKKSRYTHFTGEYCSREVKTWFFSFCLERTEVYCAFPGLLSRIVQEQGRAQLDQLTVQKALETRTQMPFNYSYYNVDGSTTGAWTPPVTVNGTSVTAWRWPAYCKANKSHNGQAYADSESQKLLEQNAQSCPEVVTTWIAACDAGTSCMPIPGQPYEGGLGWSIKSIDPLQNVTSGVNTSVVTKGACDTSNGNCVYELYGWPAGTGGNTRVTKTLTFPYKITSSTSSGVPSDEISRAEKQLTQGELIFTGVPSTGGTTVGISVRKVGTAASTGTVSTIGADQFATTEGSLPGITYPVTVSGKCEELSNTCVFKLTTEITVSAKPWGSGSYADCSGFSPNQIAALNFAKMDLSEWVADMVAKVGENTGNLAAQTTKAFQNYNSTYVEGKSAVIPGATTAVNKFAKAIPTEGFGPFDISLSVSGYWPETTGNPEKDKDAITSVEVDWDDCGPSEAMPVYVAQGRGFRVDRKTYKEPTAYTCTGKYANDKKDVIHNIKLTIKTTNSGVQTKTLAIRNSYAKFTGAESGNVSASTTTDGITPVDVVKDELAKDNIKTPDSLKLGK